MKGEWRCTRCGKLLGLYDGSRLHISFARGHEYLVSLPSTCVCRACRTLNELSKPRHEMTSQTVAQDKPQN